MSPRPAPGSPRPRLHLLPLEERLTPAVVADGGTRVLTVTLAANEAFHVSASTDDDNGKARYNLTLANSVFAAGGPLVAANFRGLGTGQVSLDNIAGYDSVEVFDRGDADGSSVTFDNSKSPYATSFRVVLSSMTSGPVLFNGASQFGAGNLSVSSTGSVAFVKSVVTTTSGSISVAANVQQTPRGGNFSGVVISESQLKSTGTGLVTVRGRGGDGPSDQCGVVVDRGQLSSGLSAITVDGTGGVSAGGRNYGVLVRGLRTADDIVRQGIVSSEGGDIIVTGRSYGTGAAGESNIGVLVDSLGDITAFASVPDEVTRLNHFGSIVVVGSGGLSGGKYQHGVVVQGDAEISSGESITVTGRAGGSASSSSNVGVLVQDGGLIGTFSDGLVRVEGIGSATAAGGLGDNIGVWVRGNATRTSSIFAHSNVSVVGRGGASNSTLGFGSVGVVASQGGEILSGFNGNVQVYGVGGPNATGVLVTDAKTKIFILSGGAVTVAGRAGPNGGPGVVATNGATISAGAAVAPAPPARTLIDPTGASIPASILAGSPAPVPVPVAPTPGAASRLVGYPQFAAGADAGGTAATLYNPDGGPRFTLTPFGGFTGGVRVAAADFTGDGVADLAVGTGPGTATRVLVFDGVTQAQLFAFSPFEAAFTGGVFVAVGDVTGDGVPELVVTPDQGGGPVVVVVDGRRLSAAGADGAGAELTRFFGIADPAFRGGARAAVGDVNGDGAGDLVVSAGFGGGPRVAVFDGRAVAAGDTGTRLVSDFFAFESGLRNGTYVAAGDVTGDGRADLIFGAGPGGGPRVRVFDGPGLAASSFTNLDDIPGQQLANFFGGDAGNRGGVRVSVKNLDGDARADLVVGAVGTSRVTAYAGNTISPAGTPPTLRDFEALPGFAGGVFVG